MLGKCKACSILESEVLFLRDVVKKLMQKPNEDSVGAERSYSISPDGEIEYFNQVENAETHI